MTDEARMADDGCTNEPGNCTTDTPTRVEFECAIEQYGVVMATIGKWRDTHKDEVAWQEMLDARADAEQELKRLLDGMQWGNT